MKLISSVNHLRSINVAPFTGAWIETDKVTKTLIKLIIVAPFTGAWIETIKVIMSFAALK